MLQTSLPNATLATTPNWVRHSLAAFSVVPILTTVYQTLVLTDVTDDVIRTGLEAEHYSMIWSNASWLVATVYGIFAGVWMKPRFGGRFTLNIGLVLFALGNLLCGAAFDMPSQAAARVVEGIGKGLVLIICRSLLYQQFDKNVMVAIGFYGMCAYATRPSTPLITALVNDSLSWRWIYWVNVPLAVMGLLLTMWFIPSDRPKQPLRLRLDWVAVTMLVGTVVSFMFLFNWYRKWQGWSSNAFAATAILATVLLVALVIWVAGGLTPDEHLRRMFRIRVYVGAWCVRMLLLVELGAVLGLMGKYLVQLRDFPRETAGWILAPASLTMAAATLLTVCFHRRSLRHVWLLVGVVGSAASLWWMSSVDNFTSKELIAVMIGCWGFFLGLFPPVFLTDEIESIDRRDALYASAIAIACVVAGLVAIPPMMSTTVSAWTDRALDSQRLNIRENRPEVTEAQARVADYFRERGVYGPELSQQTGRVLGTFATVEAAAHGVSSGLRFVSLVVATIGLFATALLTIRPRSRAGGT
jgi:MFS transporter, DHA2 family, multidrug resistance protein